MLKKLSRNNIVNTPQRPVKVLQFGEGNFLRAFVDWIIDVLNEKTDFHASVQVVQPIQQGMGTQLNQQDGLYHVVLNGIVNKASVRELRLITCVNDVINPFKDFQRYLKSAEFPELKFIVSNTTEAGIVFDANDTHANELPETFPGKLTVWLYHRFTFFKGTPASGLILLPCELIEKNGLLLKAAVLQYCDHWHLPETFKQWILNNNTFCNTLVDRIVPGFPKDTIQEIQKEVGYEDNMVVMAEPFHLWVIEGPESLKKELPVGKAGLQVKFVKDLAPYRTRKVRILNGAHTSMVPVAYLCGLRTVKESVDHPVVGNYILKTLNEEIIPTLELPPSELKQFADDVMERFQNPFIKHELISIALNSVSKYRVRVLPSALRYIEVKKTMPERLLLSLAALIRFYKGEWNGTSIAVNDTAEIMEFFNKTWATGSLEKVVKETLSNAYFWGQDLTKISGLEASVLKHLQQIEKAGGSIEGLVG